MPISPLISVILPFYNEEAFLEEAIESVLQQTYTNWELLLIDDGSTDQSPAIAKRYETSLPAKIKYCYHNGFANKGLSATRNQGISQSKGELIALLDADDVWLPGKLANQVDIFEQFPEAGMLAEASAYWFNWNIPGKESIIISVGAPADKLYPPASLIHHLYPLGKNSAPCPSGLIFTKAAFERSGGFEEAFSRNYQLYEDQAFLHKIYLNEPVYISSACQNLYRQRAGSIVQRVKAGGHYNNVRKFFLEWLEKYVQEKKLQNPELQQLLDRALMPYRHPVWYFITRKIPQTIMQFFKKPFRKIAKYLKKKGFTTQMTQHARLNSFDARL